MPETFDLILTKFTDEAITITSLFLSLVLATLVTYWFYNRNKLRKLSHQIPASVVKNYLDSIIQNSNSLKSSLFRGGGLELGEGIPSVVPAAELGTGNLGVHSGSTEELNKKMAEISALRGQLSDKSQTVEDLQRQVAELQANAGSGQEDQSEKLGQLEGTISELKNKLSAAEEALAKAPAESSNDGQMDEIIKERDELKERLMEYEIIEEDLANLKRLQQENEQLKKSLAALQGGASEAAPAPAAEEAAETEGPSAEEIAQQMLSEEPSAAVGSVDAFDSMMGGAEPEAEPEPKEEPAPEKKEAEPAKKEAAAEAVDIAKEEGEQKSAEELLSEFEKMLG